MIPSFPPSLLASILSPFLVSFYHSTQHSPILSLRSPESECFSAVNIAAPSQNSPAVNLMQEPKIGRVASRLGHLRILISIILGQRATPGYFFGHPFVLRHTGHSPSCKQQPCICPGGASLHLRWPGFQKSLESSRAKRGKPVQFEINTRHLLGKVPRVPFGARECPSHLRRGHLRFSPFLEQGQLVPTTLKQLEV